LAGLYEQAEVDEKAGGAGTPPACSKSPRSGSGDPWCRSGRESLLENRQDPARALELLGRPASITDEPGLRFRRGWLTADALDALERQPEARAVLERMRAEFPENTRLRSRLARADASAVTTNRP
jgi:hypothetical protein